MKYLMWDVDGTLILSGGAGKDALTIALPYIGYPRTLNGLSCVNAIAPSK